jgi:hypothetical protein
MNILVLICVSFDGSYSLKKNKTYVLCLIEKMVTRHNTIIAQTFLTAAF